MNSAGKNIEEREFFDYMEKGYVEKFILNKDEESVQVFVNEKGFTENPEWTKQTPNLMGNPADFTFKASDWTSFNQKLDNLPAATTENVKREITENNPLIEILFQILIWVVLFGLLWMLSLIHI